MTATAPRQALMWNVGVAPEPFGESTRGDQGAPLNLRDASRAGAA